MQTRQHLFLLGFMGCGKTHWGRILAEKLKRPFLDLDGLITTQSGKSISEIFVEKGEPDFRILERDALHSISIFPPSVVATGGGTPCFFDNMDWMNENGTTVYLNTPPTLLAERLRLEKDFRPLLSGVKEVDLQDFIVKKLQEREAFYHLSKIILEQTEDEIAFRKRLEIAILNV